MQIILLLLFFFFLHKECIAIKCYQCNSLNDQHCTINQVHFKYLTLCPPTHSYCRKAVYVYYFMDSPTIIIMRECARNTQKLCYRGRYTRDSYQLICECMGYGCNQSQASLSLTISILIWTFFIIIYTNY